MSKEKYYLIGVIIFVFMLFLVILDVFEAKSALPTLKESLETMKYTDDYATVEIIKPEFSIIKLRDPLQIPETSRKKFFDMKSRKNSRAKSGKLHLQGIMWQEQGTPQAVINGRILGVGDFVGGSQILEIQKTFVRIIQTGKEIKLSLH